MEFLHVSIHAIRKVRHIGRLRLEREIRGPGQNPFLPFIFIPARPRTFASLWAESTFAEAKIPAPARTFCKNLRLLLMLFFLSRSNSRIRKVKWL